MTEITFYSPIKFQYPDGTFAKKVVLCFNTPEPLGPLSAMCASVGVAISKMADNMWEALKA